MPNCYETFIRKQCLVRERSWKLGSISAKSHGKGVSKFGKPWHKTALPAQGNALKTEAFMATGKCRQFWHEKS